MAVMKQKKGKSILWALVWVGLSQACVVEDFDTQSPQVTQSQSGTGTSEQATETAQTLEPTASTTGFTSYPTVTPEPEKSSPTGTQPTGTPTNPPGSATPATENNPTLTGQPTDGTSVKTPTLQPSPNQTSSTPVPTELVTPSESGTTNLVSPTPTEIASTPWPDGELYLEIDNAALVDILPVTTVRARPIGAVETSTQFTTSIAVITAEGTLNVAESLTYLLDNFAVSSVVVSCDNGLVIPLGMPVTCPGSTTQEQQSRTLTFTGSTDGGVQFDPETITPPLLQLTITEHLEVERRPTSGQRQTSAAEDTDKDYVQPMGMHW